MSNKVFVLNGPNLNMLGKREPGIYGDITLDYIAQLCRDKGNALNLDIDFRQTNHEGTLVDWLHEANEGVSGVVLNAGAYTHTSVALHDAIRSILTPVIEIHISNVHAREEFRHKSMIASASKGVICGFGPNSYTLAIQALADIRNS